MIRFIILLLLVTLSAYTCAKLGQIEPFFGYISAIGFIIGLTLGMMKRKMMLDKNTQSN